MGCVEEYLKAYTEGIKEPEGFTENDAGILLPKTDKGPNEPIRCNSYEERRKIFGEPQRQEGVDIMLNELEPKVKWFKPPLTLKIWKFQFDMTWAYKTKKLYVLKNCYPVAMSSDFDVNKSSESSEPKGITLEWNATKIEDPRVEAHAEKLRNKMKVGNGQ